MPTIESVTSEILTNGDLINVLVRVVDSDGDEGVGETWWGIADRAEPARPARPMAAVIDDLLAPRAIGRDADDIEELWHDLWDWGMRYGDQGIYLMGISGLDLALWDLRGKRRGVPVLDLLGGAAIDSLPVYASLPWLRDLDVVRQETQRALEAGYTAVKLHETGPEFTTMLRDEFGPELIIMVDVNGHFDEAAAIEHGQHLHAHDVLWFEEPVHPMRDHAAIARVGAALECDLAGGENEYTLDDFDRLLSMGALTYLQPEITKIGGMTAAKRVGALAERYDVALCPHNFHLGPSLYASIHWAFSSPASRWLEFPWFPEDVSFSYPVDLPPVVEGRVYPLTAPGLSCEPTTS